MFTTLQCCSNLSRRAVASTSSPTSMSGHSLMFLFEVMMVLPFSNGTDNLEQQLSVLSRA